MSDDLDDYAPAIEPTSNNAETSVESAPAGKAALAAAAADAEARAETPAEKIGMPPGEDDPAAGPEPGPRRPRVWTGKSRALFKQLAAKGGVGADGADDLVPMEHTPTAAAAKVAPPAPSPAATAPAPEPAPSKQPQAAPAPATAPVTPPPGLPDLPDLPLPAESTPAAAPAPTPDPKHAEREQALAAREAALAEREKLLPDRRALIEKPADAVIDWLFDTYGITDPAERKTAIADLITEISASPKGLGIGVPGEHMAGAQSRRATRVVTTYARDVDAREKALQTKQAEAEKTTAAERAKQAAAQQEAAYVSQIGERLTAARDQFPFLHDPELTNGQKPERIVYEVMQEQRRQARAWSEANPGKAVPQELQPNLAVATKFSEKFYRDQAEAISKKASRYQSLLAPAVQPPAQPAARPAAPAPAAAASPGGASGPAPTPAAKPEPQAPARDPSELPDKRSSRAATLAKLRARAGAQPNT